MSELTREHMILHNLALVNRIVARLAPELPRCVDREDLVSTGVLGLIKAVDRFDPSRGVKFETYASCLIRGEIMESLRERDPASRTLRKKIREMARTVNRLSGALGRAPRPEEAAQAMAMSLPEYQALVRAAEGTAVTSLEEALAAEPQVEARALVGEETSAQSADPAAAVEHRQFLSLVAQGVERLPEREQVILGLYYGEEMTLREIGEIFGITESRVCQLHTQALRRLRATLDQDLRLAA